MLKENFKLRRFVAWVEQLLRSKLVRECLIALMSSIVIELIKFVLFFIYNTLK